MHTYDNGEGREPGSELITSILDGVPVRRQQLDLNGIDTAVLVGGDGPPVVLLHGPGEYGALWARVIPGLVEQHRVIAPDLPGHGATPLPSGKLDAARVMGWLAELVEQTCSDPPALVGHLVGGAVAAQFAARRPGRVARLVLVDSYGLSWSRPSPRFAVPLLGFIAHPTPRSRDRFLGSCFYDFDAMREGMDRDFTPYGDYALAWARSSTAKPALRHLMPQFGTRPIPAAELAGITAETTLIWGRHDLQVKLAVAEAASARYGWPLHVIEDARDDPCFEQPEAALRALRAALGHSDRLTA